MKPAPALKLVATEPTVDITLAMRAEIEARDWGAVHVAGDRRAAVFLPERLRRVWRG